MPIGSRVAYRDSSKTSESARPRVCNGPSKVFESKFLPNGLHFTSKKGPNQGSKYFRFWIEMEPRANGKPKY
eukprot:6719818-Prymnesium_polylepis.1